MSTVAEMVQTQCMQLSWRSASPQYRIPFPYGCSCGEATLAGYFAEVWQSFSGTNSLFPSHGSSIREMVADHICGFSRTHKPSIAELRTSKHEKKKILALYTLNPQLSRWSKAAKIYLLDVSIVTLGISVVFHKVPFTVHIKC